MSVWWVIVVMMMTSASAGGTQCPVRTDALDIESRAFVAPQVVEAVVQEIVMRGSDDGDRVGGGGDGVGVLPGQPYTVTVSVSRVLRRYRGPSRVKKRATLTLTFRYPSLESDSENSGFGSDSSDDGECLVSARLRPRRKYILFLSGGGDSERGRSSSTGPVPVAPPELANKKVRRLVRKMVCKKCGGPPTVTGLRDDSVVRDYNLTLECTAQGIPAPTVHWYKDDILLTSSRNIKIRTRKRRRKMIIRERGTRTPRHSPNPFLSEGFGRRRRIRRRRRGGGGGGVRGTGAGETEGDDGGGGAAGTGTEKKRRIRGGRRREDSERRRITGRRRVVGGDDVTGGGKGGGGPERSVGGRRRRPGGRSHSKGGDGNNSHRRSGSSRNAETSNSKDSTNSNSSSSSSSSSISSSSSRRQQSGDSSRRSKIILSSLMVRGVGEEDEGVYKCVAKSVAGEATSQARIRVVPPIDPHPFVDKCPYAGYCLNGGTCMMFKIVGELVCQCADGFKGQRCQEKEVYPTFRRNCHGPLRHIRHSRGLRCPRNQPIALWELLQQSLARRQKVSPWTKTHFLSWPPSQTTDVYWPRYMPPAPHSFIVPQYVANQNGAPVHNGPHSTVSTLQQKASSKEVLHMHQTTQDPMLLDSLIPDLDHSQILRRKGHLGLHLKVSNSPVTHQQQDQTDPKIIVTPTISSTFKSPLEMKVKPNTPQNVQRNAIIGFPPTQPYDDYREDEIVQLTYHHSQRPHRHHHQRHSSHNTDPPPHDTLKEIYTTEPTRIAWDQKVTEVKLLWSSQMDSNTTPHYLTMPNQDNLQQ